MSRHTMKLAERELAPPDLTQPTADVVIGDDIYRLCFDMQALAEAEEQLIKEGWHGCLLLEMNRVTLRSTLITFTAAARKYQPWLTFEDVVELLSGPNELLIAASAISDAWNKSAAPTEKPGEGADADENPPNPS
jgi:hypothetical protein